MPQFQFVDLDSSDSVATLLSADRRIGLDTEFMREKTFYPQLCLLQIATDDGIYCADPLNRDDLESFWRKLMACQWVVHSARQDIEVLYHSSNLMPTALFDTQIAAALLGFAPQLGYAGLVKELFGVELAKSHTRADWTKRPLPAAALEYAAEDVEYLLPGREILTERLDKQGRLDWADEDSAALLNPTLYDIDPGIAINRIKGARTLRGRRRAAAARLAAWRESEALRSNRPRQWIAKDSTLIEIDKRLPQAVTELGDIADLSGGLVRRSGQHLLELIAATDADDNGYSPPSAPSEEQKLLLKKMQQIVAECAADLGLAAETVASKKELSGVIIDGNRESRLFSGWRHSVIGEHLQQML